MQLEELDEELADKEAVEIWADPEISRENDPERTKAAYLQVLEAICEEVESHRVFVNDVYTIKYDLSEYDGSFDDVEKNVETCYPGDVSDSIL